MPVTNDMFEWVPAERAAEAEQPLPGSFAALCAEGARAKLFLPTCNGWFGYLVGPTLEGDVTVGFDDGDMRLLPVVELQEHFNNKLLLPIEDGDGGVVANKGGMYAAAAFTTHNATIVGVLVGDGAGKAGWGANIFFAHFVCRGRSLLRRRRGPVAASSQLPPACRSATAGTPSAPATW